MRNRANRCKLAIALVAYGQIAVPAFAHVIVRLGPFSLISHAQSTAASVNRVNATVAESSKTNLYRETMHVVTTVEFDNGQHRLGYR